jgi:GntR family transcriptional regulator
VRPATYTDIAEAIRRDVQAGRWPLGKPIPGIDRLKDEYGASRQTTNRAVQHLVSSGLLYSKGTGGTFIRPRLGPPAVVRDRHAYRDEIGYFFDRNAQDWRGMGQGTQEVGVAPDDVADLLGVDRGTHVMVRDRALGPQDADYPLQLATSYLPMPLVGELPVLGAAQTGPGGIYDRLEEHFGQALEWTEHVRSRPSSDDEQKRLRLGANVWVLVVTRTSRIGDRVVEVNQTRMAADMFAVSYLVDRDETARFPRA